jgi:hypothetical protein
LHDLDAEPLGDLIAGQRERSAVSQTSGSASPENNRQPEQDDCDGHKRRAGDVSDQDEEDGDNGEDCCDVVVHSFPIVGLPTLRCERNPVQIVRWGSGRIEYHDSNPLVEKKDPALPGAGLLP